MRTNSSGNYRLIMSFRIVFLLDTVLENCVISDFEICLTKFKYKINQDTMISIQKS
jgi:hypothetical protein